MREGRDIYGRRPTSTSRGKTQERIMALQHAPESLPGAELLDAELVPGSTSAALRAFHQGWVVDQPVTSRRAYERSIAFLVRDLDESAELNAPLATLDLERLVRHLRWRVANNIGYSRELVRATVQLTRFTAWAEANADGPPAVAREALQARLDDLTT